MGLQRKVLREPQEGRFSENLRVLKSLVNSMDYAALSYHISCRISKFTDNVQSTHEQKLMKLGASLELSSCDPSKVVFNYSDRRLSERETFLMSFGFNFNLPIFKPCFYKYFLSIEKLLHILHDLPAIPGINFSHVKNQITNKASTLFYDRIFRKVFSPIFAKADLRLLRDLCKDKNIVVCRPDKCNGVVILNKTDYIAKMENILSDTTKFVRIIDDSFTITLKLEDRINRFLSKLKSLGTITEETYKNLFVTGCAPGIIFGLTKIHKANLLLRPTLAAYKTDMYKIVKFVVPLLEPFASNEYKVKTLMSFTNHCQNFMYQINILL